MAEPRDESSYAAVLNSDGTEFCSLFGEGANVKALRIADALNATYTLGASYDEALQKCNIQPTAPTRDPDRVRLAAAALQGALSGDATACNDWSLFGKMAVEITDATLAALDKPTKQGTP